MNQENKREIFRQGVHDGIPVGLGYLAVSFALGIAMKNAGMTYLQGFFMSLLNNASAGEYAGITMIETDASLFSVLLITLITNARYLLMSFALTGRVAPNVSTGHRMCMAFDITDELFALAIGQEGYVQPAYFYGMMAMAIPGWSLGTVLGMVAGEILPVRIVRALSVALFGMFLSVVIPEAKENSVLKGCVIISFALSFLFAKAPFLKEISEGTRTILLTLLIAGFAAWKFPIEEEEHA